MRTETHPANQLPAGMCIAAYQAFVRLPADVSEDGCGVPRDDQHEDDGHVVAVQAVDAVREEALGLAHPAMDDLAREGFEAIQKRDLVDVDLVQPKLRGISSVCR